MRLRKLEAQVHTERSIFAKELQQRDDLVDTIRGLLLRADEVPARRRIVPADEAAA